MAGKAIRKFSARKIPYGRVMKLVSTERVKAPTVAGQMETIRTYKEVAGTGKGGMTILIIGDEERKNTILKPIAVYFGHVNQGYFKTLEEAKQFVYNKLS